MPHLPRSGERSGKVTGKSSPRGVMQEGGSTQDAEQIKQLHLNDFIVKVIKICNFPLFCFGGV